MKRLTILLACAVLGSCANENINGISPGKSDRLHLVATLGAPSLTKASIQGDQLPEGAQLGVSVLKTHSGSLYGNSGSNTLWTETSNGWAPSTDILLNAEEGTAYAYYPYNSSVVDIETVPVTLNQVDYCWGSSIEKNLSNSTNGTSRATIVLEHALTRIALRVYKKDYPDAVLSRIRIRSTAGKPVLCANAEGVTFNARTGQISGSRPEAEAVIEFTGEDNGGFIPVTLQNEVGLSPVASAIILPTPAFESGDLEFVLTINNREFVVPVSKPQSAAEPAASGGWNPKYSYTYEMQLTGAGLTTTGASFIAWVDVPFIELNINQNAGYSYSEDGRFLFYKKQAYERVIANDTTSVDFIIYSNHELTPSDLTVSFSEESIYGDNMQVTSERIASDVVEIEGEKVLGDWRHTVRMTLNANLNDPNPRETDVTLASAGAKISTFRVRQGGVDTQVLEEMLVEVGGQKWMPFNTSGTLAGDVATAKEIKTAGDIVTYAYARVENFRKVSGTFFSGTNVLAQRACPSGYRVPRLEEYTQLFGQAIPVRPGTTPKWLADNPTDGNMQLPNGVLNAIPHANTLNVMPVYWTFVSSGGQTLPFVGASHGGTEGTNQSLDMNSGLGIWTSTERKSDSLERVAPWEDGWANNETSKTAISLVRCVKE